MVYCGYKGKKKFAIKKLKLTEKDRADGFYKREIEALHRMKHENVVRLHECATNNRGQLFMVFDFHEYDLKRLLLDNPTLPESFVKNVMLQLCRGLKYIHDLPLAHRDIKPANLLLNMNDGLLRIADFGSCIELLSKERGRYTPNLVTLWYRAPEILFGSRSYTHAVDMWSAGCVFAELLTGKPLFDAHTEIEQINKIFGVLGSPSGMNWPSFDSLPNAASIKVSPKPNKLKQALPNVSESAREFLSKLLQYEPAFRLTAGEVIKHPYFCEYPLPDKLGTVPCIQAVSSSPLSCMFE